ncbi:MAG: hypothetical protein WA741_11880 [Candidatus Sulfotelmatobacter sp.]
MPPSIATLRNGSTATTTSRHYSAWLLGALLLLFVANARAARYDMHRRDLKLATTQSYLDSDETWLELSMAAVLLSWCGAHLGLRVFFAPTALRVTVAIPVVSPRGEFDRELRLRPPPLP